MEHIESNKMIEKFMGFEPYQDGRYGEMHREPFADNKVVISMRYHLSWNWLMPVVEKIEAIGQTIIEIGNKRCRIIPIIYDRTSDSLQWHLMHENRGLTKIEAVYGAVVSFINWYKDKTF